MSNRCGKIRASRAWFLSLFLVLGLTSVSQAGPLGVIIDPFPDILAQSISTSYNATTGAFSATGWAMTLDTGTGPQNITTNFRLTATINKLGVASGGTVTIGSALSPYLYSASLTGFAFNAAQGGALEFLFGASSGAYVPVIYSAVQPLDVMISAGTSFLGGFSSSWSGSGGTGPGAKPRAVGAAVDSDGRCWSLRRRLLQSPSKRRGLQSVLELDRPRPREVPQNPKA